MCKKCQSEAQAMFPADIRLYMNRTRTISPPPLNPPPDIAVCLDCGYAEFVIPERWLQAGWLKPKQPVAIAEAPQRISAPQALTA